MVVCICNSIREKDVRHAVRQGANCPKSVYASLGHRPNCGQCFSYAREIINEERAA